MNRRNMAHHELAALVSTLVPWEAIPPPAPDMEHTENCPRVPAEARKIVSGVIALPCSMAEIDPDTWAAFASDLSRFRHVHD